MPFQPRIAISGGGPAGLALSLLLKQRDIFPTVYELRSKPTPTELAEPSGVLDLHDESGQKVMRECGLWDDFQASTGDCSEACRIFDPRGTLLHTDEGDSSRPEIARNTLTSLLLKNAPSDYIKWNHKVVAARQIYNKSTGATEIELDLGPNGTATYDYVIGADGAWSRIRKMLTDNEPFYSGMQWLTATIRNASTNYPQLSELCGSGTFSALGEFKGIMSQRGPQDSIRVYMALSTPDEHWAKTKGIEDLTARDAKAKLMDDDEIFGKWAPPIKQLLATACEEDTKDNPNKPVDIKPMYMLPIGHRWEHHTGATLVGDAAHLMTPWAGEGVNLALWDSLDLGHVIGGMPEVENAAEWQAALETRVREHEAVMLARAQEKAEETAVNKDLFLSEHGGRALADFMKNPGGQAEES
jgi:2-polyprenyl-6-methoxyphenol hydroxylase-like FAD-dependent oxidoreductase